MQQKYGNKRINLFDIFPRVLRFGTEYGILNTAKERSARQ